MKELKNNDFIVIKSIKEALTDEEYQQYLFNEAVPNKYFLEVNVFASKTSIAEFTHLNLIKVNRFVFDEYFRDILGNKPCNYKHYKRLKDMMSDYQYLLVTKDVYSYFNLLAMADN